MGYKEGLARDEDSWRVFEEALEEAVQGYVEGFVDHLAEDYGESRVTVKGVDDREELIDVLGLDDYSVELEASDDGMRAYNIHLPEIEDPLLVDVERSVDESSIAADEDRETVAYHLIQRSEEDMKFRNVRSEFQRITRPDGVDGNVSLFYRSGNEEPLSEVSSWEFFDEKDLMEWAVERYEDAYPGEADFDVELLADSGKDWRIYEFDFDDLEEPMHLEITLRGNGFSMNWKQEENDLRYRNFVRFGFAEAIEELTD
jgi:hypothetical protein